MNCCIIQIANLTAAERELYKIGAEKAGVDIMAPKAVFRIIKLQGIRNVAANIIKQDMLSLGGEAATSYGTINHSIPTTNVLIMGTVKQLNALVQKFAQNKFGLPEIGQEIKKLIANYEKPRVRQTKIMGILNVTPDSFSDGGKFSSVESAYAHASQMIAAGVDIIDIGGESTRPGAEPVSTDEEKRRVLPIIEKLAGKNIIISIDTTKAEVAKAALAAGASMVNDISGLRFDPKMAEVAAAAKADLCVMHIQGNPRDMQDSPHYDDLMGEIINYLSEGLAIAKKAGILQEQIIVDPGIGFGKTPQQNLEIIKRLRELTVLGCPILVGPSRKSVVGRVLDLPIDERLFGTAALVAASILNGAAYVRVHDVKEMKQVAKMCDAVLNVDQREEI